MTADMHQTRNRVALDAKQRENFAKDVRDACVVAALQRYEDAKISGLCHEGAWECAINAIREVDLEQFKFALSVDARHE